MFFISNFSHNNRERQEENNMNMSCCVDTVMEEIKNRRADINDKYIAFPVLASQ